MRIILSVVFLLAMVAFPSLSLAEGCTPSEDVDCLKGDITVYKDCDIFEWEKSRTIRIVCVGGFSKDFSADVIIGSTQYFGRINVAFGMDFSAFYSFSIEEWNSFERQHRELEEQKEGVKRAI